MQFCHLVLPEEVYGTRLQTHHLVFIAGFFLSVQSHAQCAPLLQLYQFPPLSLLCPDLPLSLIFLFDI